jgi:hypothetical protein
VLVTIIYNIDFRSNAYSLKESILDEWDDADINLLGINNTLNNAKYQVQFNGSIIYSSRTVTSNASIISLIEDILNPSTTT